MEALLDRSLDPPSNIVHTRLSKPLSFLRSCPITSSYQFVLIVHSNFFLILSLPPHSVVFAVCPVYDRFRTSVQRTFAVLPSLCFLYLSCSLSSEFWPHSQLVLYSTVFSCIILFTAVLCLSFIVLPSPLPGPLTHTLVLRVTRQATNDNLIPDNVSSAETTSSKD